LKEGFAMLPKIKPPYFELGPKNYMYDDGVEKLAYAVRTAAERYDIRVIYSVPFLNVEKIADIFRGSENCYVFAPFMDDVYPGNGVGTELPERLKASGVQGVYINHSARPQSIGSMLRLKKRAQELGIYTMACAGSLPEIRATAVIGPDILIAEPEELIGSGQSASTEYIRTSIEAVEAIDPRISVLIGAGISSGADVYKCIYNGADATGSASGIFKSPNPEAMVFEMFEAVRRGWDDRHAEA